MLCHPLLHALIALLLVLSHESHNQLESEHLLLGQFLDDVQLLLLLLLPRAGLGARLLHPRPNALELVLEGQARGVLGAGRAAEGWA